MLRFTPPEPLPPPAGEGDRKCSLPVWRRTDAAGPAFGDAMVAGFLDLGGPGEKEVEECGGHRIDINEGSSHEFVVPGEQLPERQCFLAAETPADRKSTRLNSSHRSLSRMPSSA